MLHRFLRSVHAWFKAVAAHQGWFSAIRNEVFAQPGARWTGRTSGDQYRE